jgi:hypothetical protein
MFPNQILKAKRCELKSEGCLGAFQPASPAQKYCPVCRPAARRIVNSAAAAAAYAANPEFFKQNVRNHRQREKTGEANGTQVGVFAVRRCEYQKVEGCLVEFLPASPNQKYCKVCKAEAKRALSRQHAADRYRDNPKKYAKITRENRWKRAKASGRPVRRLTQMRRCQHKGKGCLATFKPTSSGQKYCTVCQKLVDAARSQKYRERHKDKIKKKSQKRWREIREALAKRQGESASTPQPAMARHRGRPKGIEETTRSRITLAAGFTIDGIKRFAMKGNIFPDQHLPTLQYASVKALFRRYRKAIDADQQRLAALSEAERKSVISQARAALSDRIQKID